LDHQHILEGGAIDAGTNPDIDVVVNPDEIGPTGWGPLQDNPYRTAHTTITTRDYSIDRPIGKSIFAHYPRPRLINPYRNAQTRFRDGMDVSDLTYRPVRETVHGAGRNTSVRDRDNRMRGSGAGTIEDPLSVPYVETVPPVSLSSAHPPGW
jgi:hypothetical protein